MLSKPKLTSLASIMLQKLHLTTVYTERDKEFPFSSEFTIHCAHTVTRWNIQIRVISTLVHTKFLQFPFCLSLSNHFDYLYRNSDSKTIYLIMDHLWNKHRFLMWKETISASIKWGIFLLRCSTFKSGWENKIVGLVNVSGLSNLTWKIHFTSKNSNFVPKKSILKYMFFEKNCKQRLI